MEIVTNMEECPYGDRKIYLLYGNSGIGKSWSIYHIAEKGEFVYLISADRGTGYLKKNWKKYKGHIIVYYVHNMQDVRQAIKSIHDRIEKIGAKKGYSKLWVAIDTLSHLQKKLLYGARQSQVENPEKEHKKLSHKIRDMVAQVDWNINAVQMTEIMEKLLDFPCNVVMTALEKCDPDSKLDRPRNFPDLSGAAYTKVIGDCDVAIRISLDEQDKRRFYCHLTGGWYAKDRFDVLPEESEPNLLKIRDILS